MSAKPLKLDILAFGAHPDDIELSCSGTLMHHIAIGFKVGIVDLTEGEMGTRGSVPLRYQESAAASAILGIQHRDNLKLPDGFIKNTKEFQIKVIEAIRKYQPTIIITNALQDRHPDHGNACELVKEASFLAGLRKIETLHNDKAQEAWRPNAVFNYIQDRYIKPDLIVDITPYWDRKIQAIMAYKSQFYDPNSIEPDTYIASKLFIDYIESRHLEMGRSGAIKYAEGFTTNLVPKVKSLLDII